MMSFYEDILEYISNMAIIDTHEHLPERSLDYEFYSDTVKESFSQYIISDLVSAGLDASCRRFLESDAPVGEKWKVLDPYWEKTKNTGYARAVSVMARKLYGIDKISADTIEAMDAAFHALPREGRFRYILKNLCKIEQAFTCMEYHPKDYDQELFVPVWALDDIFAPENLSTIFLIEEKTGIHITTFDSYIAAADKYIDWLCHDQGRKVFKLFSAYGRSLCFPQSDRNKAEQDFQNFCSSVFYRREWSDETDNQRFEMGKHFQNYMLHRVLARMAPYGITVQVHTGIQEGNYNRISNSNPMLMEDLFTMYRGIRFVLFHMSYPFTSYAIALTKHHPNVCLDLCWAHIISPCTAVNVMLEFYDTAPWNKICGFGGDSTSIDMVYGNLIVARENIAEFLAVLYQKDRIDLDAAKELAWRLLWKNPKDLLMA